MKGRCWIFIFLIGRCFFFASVDGYSQESAARIKPAPKQKKLQDSASKTAKTGSAKVYVVKQGDSLWEIARSQGTTLEKLKSANKLRKNTIQIGQALKIPAAKTAVPKTSRVSPKESASAAKESDDPEINEADEITILNESDASEPLRVRLVKAGVELLGTRYRYQGASVQSGFDCSGLVKSLFASFNIDLPRSSREQFKKGEKVDKSDLEVGDLVFFGSGGKIPNHVGIYIGDNRFLHAARKPMQVIISDLNRSWYVQRFLGARRMVALWWDDLTATDTSSN